LGKIHHHLLSLAIIDDGDDDDTYKHMVNMIIVDFDVARKGDKVFWLR